MAHNGDIAIYDPQGFTGRFMPGDELRAAIAKTTGSFFILPVEDMYRHLNKIVPASKATTHSLIFITGGHANMTIGSQRYCIGPNQLFAVAAGQVFSFAPGDVNAGYICNFNDAMLSAKLGSAELLNAFEFLKTWGNPRICCDGQAAQYIVHLLKRLLAEYHAPASDADVIQANLISLLYEINRVYKPLPNSNNLPALSIVNKFKQLVFTHIKQQQKVADYAAMLCISPNHLNKTIKAITGKSASAWIDDALIAEARVLLAQTSLSIAQIATTIGMDDASYFSRFFKKHTGQTPSRFRG